MIKSRKGLFLGMGLICTVLIIGSFYFFICNKRVDNYAELMKGNFSVLGGIEEREIQSLETIFQNEEERGDMEWIAFDLNNDGKEELIWRYKEEFSNYMRSIVAIFGETQGICRLILFDTVDVTEFYALENGNLFYYWQYFWLYQYASYQKCTMSENFEIEAEKELEVYIIPSYEFLLGETDEKWVSELEEEYPFINGEGNYFKLITYREGKEKEGMLTKKEWMGELESILGTSLEKANTYLYELIAYENNVKGVIQ